MAGTATDPSVSRAPPGTDPFAAARQVADAVLYEGYLLYPYRRSTAKNRVRWQFGVLAPPAWIEHQRIPDPGRSGAAESWFQQVDCLAEAPPTALVRVELRFLQLQHKQLYEYDGDGARRAVDTLDTAEGLQLTFDEAVAREVSTVVRIEDVLSTEQDVVVDLPGRTSVERLPGADGEIERTCWPVRARIVVGADRARSPFPLLRLRIRVENVMELADPAVPRELVLRHSLIAAHILVGLGAGRFLSLLDPPAWAADAVAAADNRHVFPVLAGADDGNDALLCSPIILYDHPKIAPESPGDLHDATEIDEILSLRTLTLTDAEKREARGTDPRAAAIVDRVDSMPAELLAKLHGTLRDLPSSEDPDELPWWDPRAEAAVAPETDTVLVGGRRVGRGALVRLRPRGHGSDAHDMFLTGRKGRVHAVLHDVDGSVRLAVTVDDDPGADLHEWYGRFFHFTPDEVEPLEAGA
jgi:hypothetical protein